MIVDLVNEGDKYSGQKSDSSASALSAQHTFPEITARAGLVLVAVACSLLDRQIAAQASAFEKEYGFTECLQLVRSQVRSTQSTKSASFAKE